MYSRVIFPWKAINPGTDDGIPQGTESQFRKNERRWNTNNTESQFPKDERPRQTKEPKMKGYCIDFLIIH